MKKVILLFTLLFSMVFNTAQAELYLELALEGGGDELIGTNTGEEINAGGGIKFAAGIQNDINDDASASIRLSLGYLFDNINADNGEADFDTLTFDAMYIVNSGPHSFGFGGTLHMDPEYTDKVDGFRPLKIEFDDAVGVVVQYGYHFVPNMELGVRLTNIDYESGSNSIDAGSFGLYLSNGF